MIIPQSIIEPFEPLGFPTIGISGDHIMEVIEKFFDVLKRTANITGSDMDDDVRLFCSITEKLVRKLGAISGSVTVRDEIRDSNGKLLAASLDVHFRIPNGNLYVERFKLG